MSLENLQRFKEVVLSDVTLQQQLSATQGKDSLIELAVRLGAEQGYDFTPDEVEQEIQNTLNRISEQPQVLLNLSSVGQTLAAPGPY